jgi:hypothetical protein
MSNDGQLQRHELNAKKKVTKINPANQVKWLQM